MRDARMASRAKVRGLAVALSISDQGGESKGRPWTSLAGRKTRCGRRGRAYVQVFNIHRHRRCRGPQAPGRLLARAHRTRGRRWAAHVSTALTSLLSSPSSLLTPHSHLLTRRIQAPRHRGTHILPCTFPILNLSPFPVAGDDRATPETCAAMHMIACCPLCSGPWTLGLSPCWSPLPSAAAVPHCDRPQAPELAVVDGELLDLI